MTSKVIGLLVVLLDTTHFVIACLELAFRIFDQLFDFLHKVHMMLTWPITIHYGFIRSVLDQFIKKSASIAVPVGVSALDENSCPMKARTKAKTYSLNKPAKYAIRFYAVVGHKFCYLSSMFDNRAVRQRLFILLLS